ncbi:MAG: hypothetical protein ACTS2F_29800 [Thainema sp.]
MKNKKFRNGLPGKHQNQLELLPVLDAIELSENETEAISGGSVIFLFAAATSNTQRLQEEFSAELATLRGRVDA